ncbi:hypothetical protein BGX27_005636 [Mortierella sp. AM989]|nr:hypothetical protein BGX27_005636 [Mortierella sp. AM989]
MSKISGIRGLSFLSLAVIFICSFIVQTGHAFPVELVPLHVRDDSFATTRRQLGSVISKAGINTSQPEQLSTSDPAKDTSAKKTKKKKKKKKVFTGGPPPIRRGQFRRPTFDQQSLSEFFLSPVDTPWRHRMTYSLEWNIGPQFLDQIKAAQRDNDLDDSLVFPEHKPNMPLDKGDDQFKEMTEGIAVTQKPLSMDIYLVPLDPAKPNELLLSRLDVASGQAKIQVRTEIPLGWYRLEIHFWERAIQVDNDGRTSNANQGKEVWDLSVSSLISSPGHAKPNATPTREVGVWRGKEAIEVTTLIPEFKEWTEFVETVSQESKQERWNTEEFAGLNSQIDLAQRRRERKQAILEEHRSEEEFRMPKPSVDSSGLKNQMKSLVLRLWGTSKSVVLPEPTSFERTLFPQESFRFKEAMAVVANREGTPDFHEEELEMMEEEEEEEERQHVPSLRKLAWNQAMEELGDLAAIWNERMTEETNEDDDGLDQNESYGSPPTGLSDLEIHIENGKTTVQPGMLMTWRENRDRTVSWRITDTMNRDDVLLTIELIKAPGVINPSVTDDSHRMKTRAELIQKSLQQERLSLLTDRVPGWWGAAVVRMPTWILPGTYQLRLKGVGKQGVEWADVSQPFVVQSDPYLYS